MATNVEKASTGFITASKQAVVPGSCDAERRKDESDDEKSESLSTKVVSHAAQRSDFTITSDDTVLTATAEKYMDRVPVEEPMFILESTYVTTDDGNDEDNKQSVEPEIHGAKQLFQLLSQDKSPGPGNTKQENESNEKEEDETLPNKFADIVNSIQEPAFVMEQATNKDTTTASSTNDLSVTITSTSGNVPPSAKHSEASDKPDRVPVQEPECIIEHVEIKPTKDETSTNLIKTIADIGSSIQEPSFIMEKETNKDAKADKYLHQTPTEESSSKNVSSFNYDDRVPVQEPKCVEEHAYVCGVKQSVELDMQGAKKLKQLLSHDKPSEPIDIKQTKDSNEKTKDEAKFDTVIQEPAFMEEHAVNKDSARTPIEEAINEKVSAGFITTTKQTLATGTSDKEHRNDSNEKSHHEISYNKVASPDDKHNFEKDTDTSTAPKYAGHTPVHEPECVEEHAYLCGDEQSVEPGVLKLKHLLSQDKPSEPIDIKQTKKSNEKTKNEAKFVAAIQEKTFLEEHAVNKDTEQNLTHTLSQEKSTESSDIKQEKDEISSKKLPDFVVPVQEPTLVMEQASNKDTSNIPLSGNVQSSDEVPSSRSVSSSGNVASSGDIPSTSNVPSSRAVESSADCSKSSKDTNRVPVHEPECVEEHTYVCGNKQLDGQKNKKRALRCQTTKRCREDDNGEGDNNETAAKQKKIEKNSGKTKKKVVCDGCQKLFVRIDLHKCKSK